MKERIKQIITTTFIASFALFASAVVPVGVTLAVDPATEIKGGISAAGGETPQAGTGLRANIKIVINVLLFIIGVVSVIMIVLGGLKYVLSNGDSAQVTSAKNTILYAIIGLVIALLAFAIVNFVVDQFVKTP